MTISADPLKDMQMEGFGGEYLHVQGEASNKVTEKKQSNREKASGPTERENDWGTVWEELSWIPMAFQFPVVFSSETKIMYIAFPYMY